jgi:hypothetical protein
MLERPQSYVALMTLHLCLTVSSLASPLLSWTPHKDPSKLVSDDQVAEAFNFMSGEFHVSDPTHLTGADVSHYRGVMSAIWPHVFSPKSVSGSRPVGAVVMLYMLINNGGMTEGVKKVGGPSGFAITGEPSHTVPGSGKNSNLLAIEYETASATYFGRLSPEEAHSFLDRLAKIMALPEER